MKCHRKLFKNFKKYISREEERKGQSESQVKANGRAPVGEGDAGLPSLWEVSASLGDTACHATLREY